MSEESAAIKELVKCLETSDPIGRDNIADALCGISSALHRIADALESGAEWNIRVLSE